jgi:signal transduction histidine kinase
MLLDRLNGGRWLLVLACIPLATTLWVSYRAVVEWQHSAKQVAESRAETAADLLITALARDMGAVQLSVLSRRDDEAASWPDLSETDLIASAFARYPYPEVFFTSRSGSQDLDFVFYSRPDRFPSWISRSPGTDPFPVIMGTEPQVARRLLKRIAQDVTAGRRYAVFDMTIGERTYQVVSRLSYRDSFREQVATIFGFMVDLAWAQEHYFPELTAQVARVLRASAGGVDFVILDQQGRAIAGQQPDQAGIAAQRQFSRLFFDPRLVAVEWPRDLANEVWTIQAVAGRDPTLNAASQGARRALAIALASALALAFSFVLIVRAIRANARLTEMRSEFVSSITHELNTPISTIQAIGETFASNRGVTTEVARKYGRLATNEAKRLRRLVDNLLAHARITDVTETYAFEPVEPHVLISDTLRDFASQLEYANFEVVIDVPPQLPNVKADRRSMRLALGNLVDNAIRYSNGARYLGIAAHSNERGVAIAITDKGQGIPESDVPYVTKRFFRGTNTDSTGGSGLGLAIVARIVAEHGGALDFTSVVGAGTTATLWIPTVEGNGLS